MHPVAGVCRAWVGFQNGRVRVHAEHFRYRNHLFHGHIKMDNVRLRQVGEFYRLHLLFLLNCLYPEMVVIQWHLLGIEQLLNVFRSGKPLVSMVFFFMGFDQLRGGTLTFQITQLGGTPKDPMQ